MVAGCSGSGYQSAVCPWERVIDRRALVSRHGAGRSVEDRAGKDQRHATLSLPGSITATQKSAGAASEATLWGVVRSRVRRAAVRFNEQLRGRSRRAKPDDATRV